MLCLSLSSSKTGSKVADADHRLGLGPIAPQERGARDLQRRHQRGRGRHGGRGKVERAFLDLLQEVDLLSELLGREDPDRHGAAGPLAHPLGELVEQLPSDLGGGVGVAEAQGLRGGWRRGQRPGGEDRCDQMSRFIGFLRFLSS